MEMFPAIETCEAGRSSPGRFPVRRYVEEAGDLLVDVPFPMARGNVMMCLRAVVGDEETGGSLQLLRGLRDVAQLEVARLFAGERKIARAVEQAAIVAVTTPRQNQRRDFHDLVAFAAHRRASRNS